MNKKELNSRADVQLLVDRFYDKVQRDATIGPIFTEIAKVDWGKHLPVMYDFWSSILLGEHSYSGNPMPKHIALSKMTTMSSEQFTVWLAMFNETVDALFTGEVADMAKLRAANIARIMQFKIQTN